MAAAKALTIVDRWEVEGERASDRERRGFAEKGDDAQKKMNSGMDI